MKKQIIINLPVADLKKSMDFYTAIGFTINPQFSDDTAAFMVWSEEIMIMLLTHEKFRDLTKMKIADTRATAAVFNSLTVESNDVINDFMTRALNAGATEPTDADDFGFMQQRSMADLDGHLWLVLYMDLSKLPQQ